MFSRKLLDRAKDALTPKARNISKSESDEFLDLILKDQQSQYKELMMQRIVEMIPTSSGTGAPNLADVIKCVHMIMGKIPGHLLKYDKIQKAVTILDLKDKDPIKISPIDFPPFTFKSYCNTLPLLRWLNIYAKASGVFDHTGYALLTFMMYPERFEPYLDSGSRRREIDYASLGSNFYVPDCYTNYNVGAIVDVGIEFLHKRRQNLVKRRKIYSEEKFEKLIEEKRIGSSLGDYIKNTNFHWNGGFIYKPDTSDADELKAFFKRLMISSRKSLTTCSDLYEYCSPSFLKFKKALLDSGQDLFTIKITKDKNFAKAGTSERFKNLAEELRNLAEISEELSEKYKNYEEAKLIRKNASNEELLSVLMARKLLTDPLFWMQEEIHPTGWYLEESLIIWLCRGMIQ